MFIAYLFSFLLLLFAGADHALAAATGCFTPTKPVNKSYEEDASQIEAAILQGCDPPAEWRPQGGTRRGAPGGGGLITNIGKTSSACPATQHKDNTCSGGYDFTYPKCTGRPGGKEDNGAIATNSSESTGVCDYGSGEENEGVDESMPSLSFPGFGMNTQQFADDCLINFLTNVLLNGGSDMTGDLANNVNFNVNTTGDCVGGDIEFCGFGLDGKLCLKDLSSMTGNAASMSAAQMNNNSSSERMSARFSAEANKNFTPPPPPPPPPSLPSGPPGPNPNGKFVEISNATVKMDFTKPEKKAIEILGAVDGGTLYNGGSAIKVNPAQIVHLEKGIPFGPDLFDAVCVDSACFKKHDPVNFKTKGRVLIPKEIIEISSHKFCNYGGCDFKTGNGCHPAPPCPLP